MLRPRELKELVCARFALSISHWPVFDDKTSLSSQLFFSNSMLVPRCEVFDLAWRMLSVAGVLEWSDTRSQPFTLTTKLLRRDEALLMGFLSRDLVTGSEADIHAFITHLLPRSKA